MAAPVKVAPAKVETKLVGEADLVTLTLTAKAVERLGIETEAIAEGSAASLYEVAGEAVLPPGQVLIVSAPVSGLVSLGAAAPQPGQRIEAGQVLFSIKPLLPLPRDLRINAEAELGAAQARLAAAQERTARATQMLADRVGSERALQDAQELEIVAKTAVDAARARLEQIKTAPLEADVEVPVASPEGGVLQLIQAAPGQMVSGGAPLFQVARLDPIWVRTPVYSGDVGLLDLRASALVKRLNSPASEDGLRARPAPASPSADPLASTSDLFYALPNPSGSLRPGERLSISILRRTSEDCLQAPWEAVLYDINGGSWVYEQIEPLVFTRRRVSIDRRVGESVCLAAGPAAGTRVVTAGAAELFGTEFGGSK